MIRGVARLRLVRSKIPARDPLRTLHCFAPLRHDGRLQDARVPRLTLFTGTDCQLCDVAKAEIDALVKDVPPFDLTLFNIRDDSLHGVQRWRRAYQYDIPVLHLDGREVARHRIRRDELARQIRVAAMAESDE